MRRGGSPREGDAAASGYSTDTTVGGFDAQLDATGLSTSAVQVSILKGKLRAQEQELQRMKADLKAGSERVSALNGSLHEQKLLYHETMQKYSAAMDKLNAADKRNKELDDELLGERRQLHLTKESLQRHVQSARTRDEQSASSNRQLEERIADLQHSLADAEASQARALSDNERAAYKEMTERLHHENEDLVEAFRSAIDHLVAARDEDEASLFVARSAALSCASELDAKLKAATVNLDALREAFTSFVTEVDRDTNEILTGLMEENKTLFETVGQRSFENDQLTSQLAAERRRAKESEGPLRDQVQFLQAQLDATEAKLARSSEKLDSQTQKERELEEHMRRLTEELQIRQQRVEQAESERAAAMRAESDASRRANELSSKLQDSTYACSELERERDSLSQDVERLDSELKSVRETITGESRKQIGQLRMERDDALSNLKQTSSDLDEAVSRVDQLQRQLAITSEQAETFKARLEDVETTYRRTLSEELSSHKNLYEEQIDALKREVADANAEADSAEREMERLRSEAATMKHQLARAEEGRIAAENEAEDTAETVKKLERRIRDLTLELDSERSARQGEASKASELEATAATARAQLDQEEARHSGEIQRLRQRVRFLEEHQKELDQQKTTVTEEVRKLRLRSSDDGQLNAFREKAERDRAMLQRENERLQRDFADAHDTIAQRDGTIALLKQRLGSMNVLQAEVDDLKTLAAELPGLRMQIEQYQEEIRRTHDDARALQRERDEMAQKLEHYLERVRLAADKDHKYDQIFRDATSQIDRLDRQLNATQSSVARRRSPSPYERDALATPPSRS